MRLRRSSGEYGDEECVDDEVVFGGGVFMESFWEDRIEGPCGV